MCGDLGALQEAEGFEPVEPGEKLVSFVHQADGDGVDQPRRCDLIAEPADRVGVSFEPGVAIMYQVQGSNWDQLERPRG